MHHSLFTKEVYQWLIVLCWFTAACLSGFYLSYAANPFKIDNMSDPRAESSIAQSIMTNQFAYGGSKIFILYKSTNLHTYDSEYRRQLNKSLNGLKDLPYDHRIISPYENTDQIADNKRVAYAVIETELKSEVLANSMDELTKLLGEPKNLEIYIGGDPSYTAEINHLSEENLVRGELIAMPICLIAMVFIFSGVMAALLTIMISLINIAIIVAILYILGFQMDLSVFVLNIASMLGLGISLDYTLLITYRFREEFAKYHNCSKTLFITLATAGKAVTFSAIIVMICIASLIFFPINILYSIGIGGVIAVAVTLFSSVTLLPACLCLFQKYITPSNKHLKSFGKENVKNHRWYRFAKLVMRYPFTFMIPTILILLMLGYPFLNVKINSSDAKILPTWTDSRKVLDQFNSNFSENELSPINIVLTAKNKNIFSKANVGAIYDYVAKLKKDKRIEKVVSIVSLDSKLNKQQYQTIYSTSPLPFSESDKKAIKGMAKGKYTVISVISKYSKDDDRNFELIESLREGKVGNNITKHIGGISAEMIDTMTIVLDLFVKVLIVISIMTYLLLFVLLRSLILPLKAIIMNLLSLSVCFGMLVFIFQEGHFSHLLNFTPLGFTDLNLPIILFFILFGLSMDYEVFLLSRIKEYYEKTKDNNESVALGIERSARIITSAALIMVIVTLAFVSADIVFIKAFGLGTALAIAIDATLIRLLLVPATMRLLGDWNWYIPKWLDRILPDWHFDKE